jgi:DcuC family C4-dicarboxylate transporter
MPVIPAVLVVLVVGGFFLFRRADVRLVLMLSAAVMFFVRATQPEVAGKRIDAFAQFFTEFAAGMTRLSAVVPICSAMGFAYVCKLTECDAHLVHLLCHPLRHVRWLLIPGGVAVTFFVNSAIVSQTSTVSVVGPVLIPLLVGAGISRQTGGAMLLLGGSMGGELLNPAAVEVAAISKVTNVDSLTIIRQLLPYNLLACGTALVMFWMMSLMYERRARTSPQAREENGMTCTPGSIGATMAGVTDAAPLARINPLKACVPLVPIVLLMFVRPLLRKQGLLPDITEQATIGAAMLIGVVCAAASAPGRISGVAAMFFEGAGFAYAHVISVITAASMFAASIEVNGLIQMMAGTVQGAPALVTASSVVIPWLMATVTGTAVGTAPLVISILLPVAMKTVDPSIATQHALQIGGANAIAAQFGRTSSPVAPVVIMCATLAQSRPLTLVKRVVLPLLAGGVVLFVATWMRWF